MGRRNFRLTRLRLFLAERAGKACDVLCALEFRTALPKTPVGKLSKKELIAEEKAL